ncbi:MAG: glycosyltransferase [Desulfarculaceae bacterium]|nr:glycosyltransferase [Desulfarculaceae bacterium]
MDNPKLPEHEIIDDLRQVWRVPLKSRKIPQQFLARISCISEWGIKLLIEYGRLPIHIVQCHSLSCLPVAVLFKRLYGSRLVYDCHELETETVASKGARRFVSKALERALITQADRVLVVGEFIRRWYEEHYGRGDVVVVRNVPYRSQNTLDRGNKFKHALGLSPRDMLFIYQGVFTLERKTDLLLRTFAECSADKHVVFMGKGRLQDMVMHYADRYSNIHYQPAVLPEEIIAYTSSADVGLSILTDDCLNHYYCLPNKFFEYLTAGLPVLASDFPEMGAFIDEHGCGWRAPGEERELAAFIAGLTWEEVNEKRRNALATQGSFGWEDEAEKLLAVYRGLQREIGNH